MISLKNILPLVCLLLTIALVPAPASAGDPVDFDRIVFLGDSLSDSGNAYLLLGEVSTPPFDPIPSAPYGRGGRHFSNGYTWAENVARGLGMTGSGRASFKNPGGFTNYAVGGSRARLEGDINLFTQVGLFAQDFPVAPVDALYAIVIGGNDLRDAIEAFAIDPTGATSALIIEEAVTAIGTNITALAAMGATQFLVGNGPDLGLTPVIRDLGPDAQLLATTLTVAFNDGLAATLDALEVGLGLEIVRIDLFQFIQDVVADPGAFGLSDAIAPCLTFFVVGNPYCSEPSEYLFLDGIHPTRAAHAVLAEIVLGELE